MTITNQLAEQQDALATLLRVKTSHDIPMLDAINLHRILSSIPTCPTDHGRCLDDVTSALNPEQNMFPAEYRDQLNSIFKKPLAKWLNLSEEWHEKHEVWSDSTYLSPALVEEAIDVVETEATERGFVYFYDDADQTLYWSYRMRHWAMTDKEICAVNSFGAGSVTETIDIRGTIV